MAIRVLLADDHAVLRDGLRALLGFAGDIEVVGEAEDGAQALEEAQRLHPDVVIMDIAMPGMDGVTATREILARVPACKILVLTQHDNREYVLPIIRAGAGGYMLKKAAGADLVSAIRSVHSGGAFLHPSVARAVLDGYVGHAEGHASIDRLTDREVQVLTLVAEGRSNHEIAESLVLSTKTVMGHRANLMQKLGLHSRTDLVKFAIRHGLVRVDT